MLCEIVVSLFRWPFLFVVLCSTEYNMQRLILTTLPRQYGTHEKAIMPDLRSEELVYCTQPKQEIDERKQMSVCCCCCCPHTASSRRNNDSEGYCHFSYESVDINVHIESRIVAGNELLHSITPFFQIGCVYFARTGTVSYYDESACRRAYKICYAIHRILSLTGVNFFLNVILLLILSELIH